MKSFEQRKKEYLKKLNKNQDIKYLMLAGFFENNDFTEKIDKHFNPKNEIELEMAECTFELIYDGEKLKEMIMDSRINKIPAEDNMFYKVLINIINLTKTKDTIKEYENFLRSLTPVQTANIYYGMIVGYMLDNGDKSVVKYIADNTGYNIESEEDFIQLNSRLESAKLSLPAPVIDEKYAEEYREFANEFHRLCIPEKGMQLTR